MTNDERRDPSEAGTTVDRRSVVTGGAAAAVATAMPGAALGQPATASPKMGMLAAVYEDLTYLGTFTNSVYAKGNIDKVHQFVTDNFGRADLRWGLYQKDVEPDPLKWGKQAAFDNWEEFSQEARVSLEKQPGQQASGIANNAMNPSDPTKVAPNLMEHLDEVIRIALWDNAVPINVEVNHRPKRHHGFWTKWDITVVNGNLRLDRLTLHMDCPQQLNGWQGVAAWRNKNQTHHITSLTATWQVPKEPSKKTDQIFFIFNGLESISALNKPGGILQAVLQWTKDGWAVRSWYVRADFDVNNYPGLPAADTRQDDLTAGNGRCYSKAVSVNVGDFIKGVITGNVDINGKFNYQCAILRNDTPVNDAGLSMPDIPEPVYAACAVESYNVTDPSTQYPQDPITLTPIDLQVKQGSSVSPIKWETNNKGLQFTTTVSDQGNRVDFTLRPMAPV
jgi:hypothetical protein